MTDTAPIVKTLMAEVRMEVREYGADVDYLLQGLGQMFQRAYGAGREAALGPGMTRDQMIDALRRRGITEAPEAGHA